MTAPLVLVVNAGSSSLKFALCRPDGAVELAGELQGIGTRHATIAARDGGGATLDAPDIAGDPPKDAGKAAELILPWLLARAGDRLAAAGHRIVHGGADHRDPVRATPAIVEELTGLIPLAPLHQPHNLAPVRTLMATLPDLPQILCFDTAFHRSQPEIEQLYALPARLSDQGIRRYGFHGLSYESVVDYLRAHEPALADARLVVAHLGAGASLCAIRNGLSVATTMGFTALDGLPMATRCGALDPGVVLHLIARLGMSAAEVEHLLYQESGLKGLSGISGDVRDLTASDSPAAQFALDLFAYRIAREIGSLAVALGGLDAIVFTGGIGLHHPGTRAAVCERLGWLGVRIDAAANAADASSLDAPDSTIRVRVLPNDEQALIAEHAASLSGLR